MKVLLRERKRHTASRVASTHSVSLSEQLPPSLEGGGVLCHLDRGTPMQPDWGYPIQPNKGCTLYMDTLGTPLCPR